MLTKLGSDFPNFSQSVHNFPFFKGHGPSPKQERNGGGVVDNTLDYQSRDRKIDPPLPRSFGWDFKPRSRLSMTSLLVGR